MPSAARIPVSVFIITRNEEENIARVLDNLAGFDEVIVVDSGSDDRTVEIAKSYPNTRVSFNAWPGFGPQKAHALSLCRHDWVLNLDADETLTPEYIEEIRRLLEDDDADALESRRILLRWGKRPRSFSKPETLIRFFRKRRGRYDDRQVHESIHVDGRAKTSSAAILHHENLTFAQRIDKSCFYARLKANDKFRRGDKAGFLTVLVIFPLTFLRLYFFKGHFLDGRGGVLTSVNAAFYNFMKYANLWDLRQRPKDG